MDSENKNCVEHSNLNELELKKIIQEQFKDFDELIQYHGNLVTVTTTAGVLTMNKNSFEKTFQESVKEFVEKLK